ncbi:MAG TPA: 6-phosphogluconolactonase [Clostridia bacterium]|nr:6-phosphogluconolactonase [Clostridia bacterium]
MTVRLEVVPEAAWAGRVADELAERLRDRPALRLCLPSGDTPSAVFDELVRRSRAGEMSFAAATIVLLDEFLGLSPGDPARCDVRLGRELLSRLDPAPAAVHLIAADGADPDAAARAHDAVAAEGLDLMLLGLGMNGHVGLNEPGSRPDSPTRVVETAPASRVAALERYGAGSVPERGITLGMDRVLAAREAWLLVTGARKAAVLARALEGPIGPDCPASLLRRHAALAVFADEPAAGRLARDRSPRPGGGSSRPPG